MQGVVVAFADDRSGFQHDADSVEDETSRGFHSGRFPIGNQSQKSFILYTIGHGSCGVLGQYLAQWHIYNLPGILLFIPGSGVCFPK